MKSTFYITTPIYYPNASPHLGTAYSTVLADIIARYHRQKGQETYFLTGVDENSQKVVKAAQATSMSPQDFTDKITETFKDIFNELEVSYTQFIRTSDKVVHWPGAQALWNKLLESGDIYKKKYTGLYCIGSESFVTEKDLRPGNLCPDHDEQPITIEEDNYFFRLSKYKSFLKEVISSDTLKIMPASRKNEVLSFLEQDLEDISFSRLLKEGEALWGIPLPNDSQQIMYVWCDALSNYISALGYGRGEENMKFWPADVHVIRKDILRFHAVFWPAMLHAAGLEIPRSIFVHGMIISGGRKMSKSLGNVIDPREIICVYGSEALRYFFAREIPSVGDGEMNQQAFKDAYNANLANGLGNLVSRLLTMYVQYDVPTFIPNQDITEMSEYHEYAEYFDSNNVSAAADFVWKKIGDIDRDIQTMQPFKLFKTDPEAARGVVYDLIGKLRVVSQLLIPILPTTAQTILELINTRQTPVSPLFIRMD